METNQSEIERYKDISLLAIDYLFEKTVGNFKWDDFDPAIRHCKELKLKTEKLYLAQNLQGLEKLLRDITKEPQLIGHLSFGNYIKEKTGYQIDVFENLKKPTNRRNFSKNNNYYSKQLCETYSPDRKHRLIVSECGLDIDNAATQVSLNSPKGGISLYMVNGINLDIKVHWRDNNSIIIGTNETYKVVSRKIKSVQLFDHIFKIELIEN